MLSLCAQCHQVSNILEHNPLPSYLINVAYPPRSPASHHTVNVDSLAGSVARLSVGQGAVPQSPSKGKYIVVFRGREPGIYSTWFVHAQCSNLKLTENREEAQPYVDCFPGALFRGYRRIQDAQQAWLDHLNRELEDAKLESVRKAEADLVLQQISEIRSKSLVSTPSQQHMSATPRDRVVQSAALPQRRRVGEQPATPALQHPALAVPIAPQHRHEAQMEISHSREPTTRGPPPYAENTPCWVVLEGDQRGIYFSM